MWDMDLGRIMEFFNGCPWNSQSITTACHAWHVSSCKAWRDTWMPMAPHDHTCMTCCDPHNTHTHIYIYITCMKLHIWNMDASFHITPCARKSWQALLFHFFAFFSWLPSFHIASKLPWPIKWSCRSLPACSWIQDEDDDAEAESMELPGVGAMCTDIFINKMLYKLKLKPWHTKETYQKNNGKTKA